MILRVIKTIFLLMCIIGLLFLPMSNIFLYNRPLGAAIKDFSREMTEKAEHTDYSASDISTFVNDYFIFYVPPAINRQLETRNAYEDKRGDYIVANLSTIQLFSYENGAEVKVEWLNGTAIGGARFDDGDQRWYVDSSTTIRWLDDIPGNKQLKKTVKLGEYKEYEIQINDWMVNGFFRLLSGVVKITSDNPISVMHHKLHEYGTMEEDGFDSNDYVNEYWDGVYSAYGKKLFTRITGDCWIAALEANTNIRVWDTSDKNDDIKLTLDRFEGWANCRNPIFEQYGFDDDLVLIAADKPVSIVAGIQSDQAFVQVFGKDGRDFFFPCFGYVMIHAPNGATIELEDNAGNQGSYKGSLDKGEMKIFDFKVAYKQQRYSSFEWAELRSNEPIYVYTFANNTWYLDEYKVGRICGEEYINNYKKITEFYPHGVVPYPADTEFKIPLRSRAYVTVVNLENGGNNIKMDFSKLELPFKTKMKSYQAVTIDFSEDSYYPMDLENEDTGNWEEPSWLYSDPHDWYAIDYIPRISVHAERYWEFEEEKDPWVQRVSRENITKGSTVKIQADHPVLVFINYNKDEERLPQGIDLIPGLTPPTKRGLPEVATWIVSISGIIIAIDMLLVTVGRRPMLDFFKK